MIFNPDRHHRRSIRQGYNYSQEGSNFVTICTNERRCLFGDIYEGERRLSELGMMVGKWWLKLSSNFSLIETDAHVIMPNRFHGIVVLRGYLCSAPIRAHTWVRPDQYIVQVTQRFLLMNIFDMLRRIPPTMGLESWQRNYYEHVIRNENALNALRNYIAANPSQWASDPDNLDCSPRGPFQ